MKLIIECFTKNYANFQGRAGRKEFWLCKLTTITPFIIYQFLNKGLVSPWSHTFAIIVMLFLLYSFIPNFSVSVRRLYDTGKSGWFLLLVLIPIIGSIIVIILWCVKSQAGENEYDNNPLKEKLLVT